VISRDKLLKRVKDTQAFLKIELERVSRAKGTFGNIRGYGTFIGFDVKEPNQV
jgi:4-aminobutyrate aminotransferase-like enzyme